MVDNKDNRVFMSRNYRSGSDSCSWKFNVLTALFNNMRTLKFKSQPTDAFFAAVNQMFGGSSQLTTTAEHCFVV